MTTEQSAPSRAWAALPLLALPFASLTLLLQPDTTAPLRAPGVGAYAVIGAFALIVLGATAACFLVRAHPWSWLLPVALATVPWFLGSGLYLTRMSLVTGLLGTAAADDVPALLSMGIAEAMLARQLGAALTSSLLSALAITFAASAPAVRGKALLKPTRGVILTFALLVFAAVYPEDRSPFVATYIACVALGLSLALARIDLGGERLAPRLVALTTGGGALVTAAVSARATIATGLHQALATVNSFDRDGIIAQTLPGATLTRLLWFAGLLALAFLAIALVIPLLPKVPQARQHLRWPITIGAVLFLATAADSALVQVGLGDAKQRAGALARAPAPEVVLPESPFSAVPLGDGPVWTGKGTMTVTPSSSREGFPSGRVVVAAGAETGIEALEGLLSQAQQAGATWVRFAAQPRDERMPRAAEYAVARLLERMPTGYDVLVAPELLRRAGLEPLFETTLGEPVAHTAARGVILQLDESTTVGELVERLAAHAARGQVVALSARREEPAVAAPAEP